MKCRHANTSRGKDIHLRWGSHRSEVCTDCGSFRHVSHVDNSPLRDWRPADEYEAATTADDEM